MSDKTFVDTNVLIYAHDVDANLKHKVAQGILRELWESRSGVLSAQVLQEFYVNVTRKIASPPATGDGFRKTSMPGRLSQVFALRTHSPSFRKAKS